MKPFFEKVLVDQGTSWLKGGVQEVSATTQAVRAEGMA
jgi:hypothetical protein